MKTNGYGAGIGAGKWEKLLVAVVAIAMLAVCTVAVSPVDAAGLGDNIATDADAETVDDDGFLALATDGVITLQKDYVLSEPIVPTQSLTIDLNGHVIDAQNHSFVQMSSLGSTNTITVKDSSSEGTGAIKNTDSSMFRLYGENTNGGNLTIESGTFYSDYCTILYSPIGSVLESKLTITGGVFLNDGTGTGVWLGNQGVKDVAISNAIFTSTGSAIPIYLGSNTNATIANCKITADQNTAVEIKAGAVSITDSTITSGVYNVSNEINHNGSGGSAATININNAYCGSARNTAVSVTIDSDTTVTTTSDAAGATPIVAIGDADLSYPISVSWEGQSLSNITVGYNDTSTALIKFNETAIVTSSGSIDRAVDNGGKVALGADITATVEIEVTQSITIDLNGFTLTNTDGSHTITNNGTLTVTDSSDEKNGAVDNKTHGKAALYNAVGATATLNGGTFERSAEAGVDDKNNGGNSYYTIQNQGTMIVNDGVTVENNGKYSSAFANGWQKGTTAPFVSGDSGERVTANLTINGGKFEGGLNTIKNDDLGVLTINGGFFTNYAQNAFMNAHIAIVNEGVFDANTEFSIYCYGADPDDGANEYIGDGKLTLNGGSFSGGIHMMGGSTLATDQDGVAMVSGNSITLEVGAKLDGTIVGPDGNSISVTRFEATSTTTITAGSLSIAGSWTGEMTVSGDDITVTGTQSDDSKIIVKPQEDGSPSNVKWEDFTQNGAQIEYRDLDGNEAEPSEVAKQTYENAKFDDETYTEKTYDVTVQVSGGNGTVSNVPKTVTDGGSFKFSFSSASGYEIDTVTCSMASEQVVSGTTSGTVTISGVTGPVNVVVTFVESAVPSVPVDDDDDLPPFIPAQPQQDDDTTTIVACAAAAVVAALMAVFLIMEYRKR